MFKILIQIQNLNLIPDCLNIFVSERKDYPDKITQVLLTWFVSTNQYAEFEAFFKDIHQEERD